MPSVQPPKVVQNAVDGFLTPLFKNKPQRKHLTNYLTGLTISYDETVAGMTEELPNASDQSCLNPYFSKHR